MLVYECTYVYIRIHIKSHINMANYSGKLLKFFYDKWDNRKILKSVNGIIKNAREKAQINSNIINSTVLKKLTTVSSEPGKLPENLLKWWQWYQYLVGLNTVEKARREVILLQNQLTSCREIRRILRQEAFINNNKLKEVYDELLRTKRDDPKYVSLTILENKTLQEQNRNNEKLNLLEEEEKDYFLQLTTAINEYQDAQALNAQKYKYISILASTIAALLSLITSMIYNNKRMKNIKQSILEMDKKTEITMNNHYKSLEESIDKRLSSLEVNLIGKTLRTWSWSAQTTPQTKPIIPQTQIESGWLDTAKKTAYIFSLLLMLKGLIF